MPDDPWQVIRDLRQDIRDLRGLLDDALTRISDLEADTPQARQLQLEADLAAADLAESGYDRHGHDCQCSYCYNPDDYDDYDPGPECDDQGGMSEYQHPLPGDGEACQ
jgi:hypothetical protein